MILEKSVHFFDSRMKFIVFGNKGGTILESSDILNFDPIALMVFSSEIESFGNISGSTILEKILMYAVFFLGER